MKDYSGDRYALQAIAEWTDEKLVEELRNPIRATLGPDGFHLLFAEALARLLAERVVE